MVGGHEDRTSIGITVPSSHPIPSCTLAYDMRGQDDGVIVGDAEVYRELTQVLIYTYFFCVLI
jgi:hypothetical protein